MTLDVYKAVHLILDLLLQAILKQLAPARLPCGTLSSCLPLLPPGPDGV